MDVTALINTIMRDEECDEQIAVCNVLADILLHCQDKNIDFSECMIAAEDIFQDEKTDY